MKFTIEINCDNDSFGQNPEDEVVRILKDICERTCYGDSSRSEATKVFDSNGNSVGHMQWKNQE